MDKKNQIFILSVVVFIIISIFITYYKYVVRRDYPIYTEVSCDPSIDNCFVVACDPVNDLDCKEGESRYYKVVKKQASSMVVCNQNNENCPEINCEKNNSDCEVFLCDESSLKEGVSCSK